MLSRTVFHSLLLLSMASSYTAPEWYQIDAIAFSRLTANTINAEQYPTITQAITPYNNDITLAPSSAVGEDGCLHKYAQIIQKNSDYELLGEYRWVLSTEQLQKGQWLQVIPSNDDAQDQRLTGAIQVRLKKYFNFRVDVNLLVTHNKLRELTSNKKLLSQPYTYFNMDQNRRTKSGQINYLDHPLMGIIMQVTAVEQNRSQPDKTSPVAAD